MAVRLSGMISGMDTDALVQELVSAYSKKKESYEKEKTKLEWTQDAWKSLNTKTYSFYTSKLSNMRFSTNYSKKMASSSNSSKASVTASSTAVNGTQSLKINKLATTGYLTGAELRDANDSSKKASYNGNTLLSELGVTEEGNVKVTVDGKEHSFAVNADTTINQVVVQLKTAGLNASFDEANQRFFVSSITSGKEHDFTLSGDANGLLALGKMGMYDDGTSVTGQSDGQPVNKPIRIAGEDAQIELNGAIFTSNTNIFSINGLTLTAFAETAEGEEISITTETDVDGIYNMVKDFIKSYNDLMKGMQTAYNADSAKGYEPLTDDEKEAMSDDEVEKWEKKVKDALLRRDDTLGTIVNAMQNAMSRSYKVGDKTYNLTTFGIGTGSYFTTDKDERGCLHIDGDADDSVTSGNSDKLRKAIASDPEAFVSAFSQIANGLYTELTKKMSRSTLSSAYTIYNDKYMKTQQDELEDTIEKWEDRLTDIEDKYYKQFAAMESAMAELQSSTTALSGLLGA